MILYKYTQVHNTKIYNRINKIYKNTKDIQIYNETTVKLHIQYITEVTVKGAKDQLRSYLNKETLF